MIDWFCALSNSINRDAFSINYEGNGQEKCKYQNITHRTKCCLRQIIERYNANTNKLIKRKWCGISMLIHTKRLPRLYKKIGELRVDINGLRVDMCDSLIHAWWLKVVDCIFILANFIVMVAFTEDHRRLNSWEMTLLPARFNWCNRGI